MARISPQRIALCCSSGASLLARIVMMMRLSAPSAICTRVTENSAAQNPGSRRRSSIVISNQVIMSTRGMIRDPRNPRNRILDIGFWMLDSPNRTRDGSGPLELVSLTSSLESCSQSKCI